MNKETLFDAKAMIRERKRLELSIEGLATRMGCSRQHIALLESGHNRPTFDTACRISDALGVDISVLRSVK